MKKILFLCAALAAASLFAACDQELPEPDPGPRAGEEEEPDPDLPGSALLPVLGSLLGGGEFFLGDPPGSLSVTVENAEEIAALGGTLGYRWYKSAEDKNSGGAMITGASGPSYAPPVPSLVPAWYYVQVTNTMPQGSVTGSRTARATSGAAAVLAWNREVRTLAGVQAPFRYVPGTGEASFRFNGKNQGNNRARITRGYWMLETEVTQELWRAVITGSANNAAPSHFHGGEGREPAAGEVQDRRPVETITWYDTIEFCNLLSAADNRAAVYTITGIERDAVGDSHWAVGSIKAATVTADFSKNGYRLPTDVEWMWAAAGATEGGPTVLDNGYAKGDGWGGGNTSHDDGWLKAAIGAPDSSTGNMTHQVGLKLPNELGLHDIFGNVWETCWDYYEGWDSKVIGPVTDYAGPDAGTTRVLHGGGYGTNVVGCGVGLRDHCYADYPKGGFRVVAPQ